MPSLSARFAFAANTVMVCAVLAGCAPNLSSADADRLASDLKPLLGSMCGNGGDVLPAKWPESLKLQQPDAVRMSADGLYIETSSFMVMEWGIFVPCNAEQFRPTPGSDPSYEKLGEAVYSYYIAD
jgi:hypothetical protein